MIVIGVDYHPSFRQIAFSDQETGECGEQRLNHSDGEAEKYYRDLKQRGVSVRMKFGTSRGCRSGAKRTRKTTLRSERGGVLKKDLTGSTLLEMDGSPES